MTDYQRIWEELRRQIADLLVVNTHEHTAAYKSDPYLDYLYPYQPEIGLLGKMFHNVYPDLSWVQLLSPNGAKAALSEWLDSVPATKIMAFGGDCGHEDHVYAHLPMAKEIVSDVLAEKVWKGCFDLDHAKWIAEQMFLMNPCRVFRLESAGITLKK